MKFIGAVAALLVVVWAGAAAAQTGAEALAQGLAGRYAGVASLTANYSRVSRTPKSDRLFQGASSQMATGQLVWQSRAKLRLDQSAPQAEAMLTDGRTVWWHIPAENVAYRYRDIDVAGQLAPLLSFLDGLSALETEFKLTAAQATIDRPGQKGLALTPKDKERGATAITVWCDEAFNLTGFQLKAPTGETTDFFLSSVALDEAVPAGLFTFRPPKGCDVVEGE